MSFDLNLIFDSLPKMLAGFGVTLQLLVVSGLLGLILAILLLLMRLSGKFYLDWIAQVYIYIFRGTPILVQIFIIYYGLPQFEAVRDSVFWSILREPTGCAILALTLNTGAYVSEILRGGVLGVDKGLLEAGSALGNMTGIARTIVADTYAPYEVFISLAIVYMIFTFGIQKLFGVFERYLGRYARREE